MKPDFDRDGERWIKEVNIGLRINDGGGKNIIDNLNGIPVSRMED